MKYSRPGRKIVYHQSIKHDNNKCVQSHNELTIWTLRSTQFISKFKKYISIGVFIGRGGGAVC